MSPESHIAGQGIVIHGYEKLQTFAPDGLQTEHMVGLEPGEAAGLQFKDQAVDGDESGAAFHIQKQRIVLGNGGDVIPHRDLLQVEIFVRPGKDAAGGLTA